MNTLENIYYFGEDSPLPVTTALQAGPVKLIYVNGSLRYLETGKAEILRMIYFAVRDHNWDTIEGEISDEKIEKKERQFHISFSSHHRKGPVDVTFRCEIRGENTGHIEYIIDGETASSFMKNRIGFCVLHPVMECVGKPCIIDHGNGVISEKKFPEWISPHQPFKDIRSMEWMVMEGVRAKVLFAGEVFETEDQRNWSDASYKTYCTPLDIPFPVKIGAGEKVRQKIELDISGLDSVSGQKGVDQEHIFSLDEDLGFGLPGIGLGASSAYDRLDKRTINLIRKISPDHIRWDLDLGADNLPEKFIRILSDLEAMETSACLALFFGEDPEKEYELFQKGTSGWKNRIKFLLLFSRQDKTTPAELINKIVPQLRADFPGVRIGGGTNAYFAELNRERVDQKDLDIIVYSVNPQVHAFDHASLTENLEAQYHTVRSARLFSPGKEIMISPVTLRPRFNPNATGTEIPPLPGELPPEVDVRQMSLYGACWTLGSIKFLVEAGINHITYFETAGWRGIVQGPVDPPEPQLFRSRKDDVFPLYQVFKWLNRLDEVSVVRTSSSNPLVFNGLAVKQGTSFHAFLANFSTMEREVNIKGSAGTYLQRSLSIENVREFMHQPDGEDIIAGSEVTRILLPPVSISWISWKM